MEVRDWRAAWSVFRATRVVQGIVNVGGTVTLNMIETDGVVSRVVNSAELPQPEDANFVGEARRALASFLELDDEVPPASMEAQVESEAYHFYLRGKGYLERVFDRNSMADAADPLPEGPGGGSGLRTCPSRTLQRDLGALFVG